MHPENHTCAQIVTHIYPSFTYTYTWVKGHWPIFTSCLHHAQLGCERMHFWQEGAGWQDPGRDTSGSTHSATSPRDEILASNSLSLLLRASRKRSPTDKATMACNRKKGGMRRSLGRATKLSPLSLSCGCYSQNSIPTLYLPS